MKVCALFLIILSMLTSSAFATPAELFAQQFMVERILSARQNAGIPSNKEDLSKWTETSSVKNVPTCPQIVSTRCLILNQFQQGIEKKSYETVRNSLDQLHQRNSIILEEPSMALIYSALLVKSKQFPRALAVLFPVISKDPKLTQPYEWIQSLYNHSDRSEGKVAIKNP